MARLKAEENAPVIFLVLQNYLFNIFSLVSTTSESPKWQKLTHHDKGEVCESQGVTNEGANDKKEGQPAH